MIVDDEPLNGLVVRKFLSSAGYRLFDEINDSREAISRIYSEPPDVLLLDLMMPCVGGLEILDAVRSDRQLDSLPILILSASTDSSARAEALNRGATDFLAKPVDPVELVPRVRNVLIVKRRQEALEQLVRVRTDELERSRREVIHCLARAAEFRDNETGRHVLRVGKVTGLIARELGYGDHEAEQLDLAATLHDVGKIGIPDAVLLKPGKLDPAEFEIMRQHSAYGGHIVQPLGETDLKAFTEHAEYGSELLDGCTSPILRMAGKIAMTHHERWDGGGYPRGLAGEDIPIEGRIVAVADVFDALSSRRPYKPSFALQKCLQIMEDGRASHFDPRVLDAFFACTDRVVEVQREYADEDDSSKQ